MSPKPSRTVHRGAVSHDRPESDLFDREPDPAPTTARKAEARSGGRVVACKDGSRFYLDHGSGRAVKLS